MSLRKYITSIRPLCDFYIKNKYLFDNVYLGYGLYKNNKQLVLNKNLLPAGRPCSTFPVQIKKRPLKKKKSVENTLGFRICAFSTAEQYDLTGIANDLARLTKYTPSALSSESESLLDAVYAVNNSVSEAENQQIFFFKEGSIVMWNLTDDDAENILNFLKPYEENRFNDNFIKNEKEVMTYTYSMDNKDITEIVNDSIVFSKNPEKNLDLNLEKYAVSNAMALSVHLGTYEANLDQYIDTMEPVTEDLKSGGAVKISRNEVLRKTGQLFAFRHNINLNSDLLDTPDFYWDREQLEKLYQKTFNYFCINKRTKVMNEKINHCIELVQLLSSHLNDIHHTRLEWMIIILIMVEVVFEVLHFFDRYNTETNEFSISERVT